MTPIPMAYVVHGVGTILLGFLTVAAVTSGSRLAPFLAFITGMVAYWLFLVLPVLFVGGALASLIVADLGIISWAARRSGTWRLFIYR